MEPVIDTSKPILVTGATVHATLRDPGDTDRIRHLTDIAASSPGTLHLFRAELLSAGDFAAPLAGCAVVLHTASPFKSVVEDPQRDLIDPAVMGTRNVLQQARDTASVTRVVLTSSCAAIYTDAADCADAPGGILTEAVI